MSKKYFVYDHENGFDVFCRASEAREEAEKRLNEYREDASSYGWNEASESVCWGEIDEMARMATTGRKIYFEGELVDGFDCKLEP